MAVAPAEEEIVYWFVPSQVPVGGAPLAIRARWVGVPLPVRRPRPVEGPERHIGTDVVDRRLHPIDDGVVVEPADALRALRRTGAEEAAAWWEQLFARRPLSRGLVFRRAEGELLPHRLALMLHPDLEDWEER